MYCYSEQTVLENYLCTRVFPNCVSSMQKRWIFSPEKQNDISLWKRQATRHWRAVWCQHLNKILFLTPPRDIDCFIRAFVKLPVISETIWFSHDAFDWSHQNTIASSKVLFPISVKTCQLTVEQYKKTKLYIAVRRSKTHKTEFIF